MTMKFLDKEEKKKQKRLRFCLRELASAILVFTGFTKNRSTIN